MKQAKIRQKYILRMLEVLHFCVCFTGVDQFLVFGVFEWLKKSGLVLMKESKKSALCNASL